MRENEVCSVLGGNCDCDHAVAVTELEMRETEGVPMLVQKLTPPVQTLTAPIRKLTAPVQAPDRAG